MFQSTYFFVSLIDHVAVLNGTYLNLSYLHTGPLMDKSA